jgi:DNA-binding CsgD family transcriptional regulator
MQAALAWAGTARATATLPAHTQRWVAPSDRPAQLHMRVLDGDTHFVRVGFSLGRLGMLSPCELEVARWANTGHSNPAIASLRQTSIHTVARHMANLLAKLRIGARLDLATIPELNAWAPPGLKILANDAAHDSWLSAEGVLVEPQDVTRMWREMAAGQWAAVASVDAPSLTYVTMRRVSGRSVPWTSLKARERDVLSLVARRVAQKVIAIKLGLAPSTVSAALHSSCSRLGFASFGQLVRAYCATLEVIEETNRGFGAPAS